jgi:hypothetical protein
LSDVSENIITLDNMSVKETLKKLITFGSKPNATTFPELLDMVIWSRFFLAVAYAINLRGRTGASSCMMGLNLITFLPFVFCTIYLGADSDSYENLTFASVPNCVGLFLLVWIYLNTLDNDAKMAGLLNVVQTVTMGDDSAESILQDVTEAGDSEF